MSKNPAKGRRGPVCESIGYHPGLATLPIDCRSQPALNVGGKLSPRRRKCSDGSDNTYLPFSIQVEGAHFIFISGLLI